MKVFRFLREWFEILLAPLVIAAFALYPKVLGDDVYAQASWSVIYLSKIIFAIIVVTIANGIAWMIVKLDNNFSKELTLWQRSLLELILYCVLFLGTVLASLSL